MHIPHHRHTHTHTHNFTIHLGYRHSHVLCTYYMQTMGKQWDTVVSKTDLVSALKGLTISLLQLNNKELTSS